MTSDERNVLLATGGLAVATVGTFLPWARIGGRGRSGFSTADTFIALASGALPDNIAWIGRWWYLPALLTVAAWATTFMRGHWAVRTLGLIALATGGAMWWLFVWAGNNYNVLNTQLIGPVVTTLGLAAIAISCWRHRGSMLRPTERPAAGPNAPFGADEDQSPKT